jgi:hypothetical protein
MQLTAFVLNAAFLSHLQLRAGVDNSPGCASAFSPLHNAGKLVTVTARACVSRCFGVLFVPAGLRGSCTFVPCTFCSKGISLRVSIFSFVARKFIFDGTGRRSFRAFERRPSKRRIDVPCLLRDDWELPHSDSAQFTHALQAHLEQDKAVKVACTQSSAVMCTPNACCLRSRSSSRRTACLCELWRAASDGAEQRPPAQSTSFSWRIGRIILMKEHRNKFSRSVSQLLRAQSMHVPNSSSSSSPPALAAAALQKDPHLEVAWKGCGFDGCSRKPFQRDAA